MPRFLLRATMLLCALTLGLISVGAQRTGAQSGELPAPQPFESPCVTDVTFEMLGQTMPATGDGQALVVVRLTIAPGGGFGPHSHPGTITVWIESGEFSFTLLEAHDHEMTINRVSTDGTPSPVEPVAPNQETVMYPGDWFAEEGTVHESVNRGEEPIVVILSALVDPAQPLVVCA